MGPRRTPGGPAPQNTTPASPTSTPASAPGTRGTPPIPAAAARSVPTDGGTCGWTEGCGKASQARCQGGAGRPLRPHPRAPPRPRKWAAALSLPAGRVRGGKSAPARRLGCWAWGALCWAATPDPTNPWPRAVPAVPPRSRPQNLRDRAGSQPPAPQSLVPRPLPEARTSSRPPSAPGSGSCTSQGCSLPGTLPTPRAPRHTCLRRQFLLPVVLSAKSQDRQVSRKEGRGVRRAETRPAKAAGAGWPPGIQKEQQALPWGGLPADPWPQPEGDSRAAGGDLGTGTWPALSPGPPLTSDSCHSGQP